MEGLDRLRDIILQDLEVGRGQVPYRLPAGIRGDDVDGHEFSAALELGRLGQNEDAAVAFGNIARLLGSNATTEGDLGEAIVRANQGAVTGEARAAFERAVRDDPKDIRAEIFKFIENEGKIDEAIDLAVRQKIETQKRGIPEGSEEWDILYRKYFEEESARRRR